MVAQSAAARQLACAALSLATRFFSAPGRRSARTRDRRALALLNERTLRDIGLSRLEVTTGTEKLILTARDE